MGAGFLCVKFSMDVYSSASGEQSVGRALWCFSHKSCIARKESGLNLLFSGIELKLDDGMHFISRNNKFFKKEIEVEKADKQLKKTEEVLSRMTVEDEGVADNRL